MSNRNLELGRLYREEAKIAAELREPAQHIRGAKPVSLESRRTRISYRSRLFDRQLSAQKKAYNWRSEGALRYNKLASTALFKHYNPNYSMAASSGLAKCDLHEQFKDEAKAYVERHILLCKSVRVRATNIVTGRGNHSVERKPVLRGVILAMLQGRPDLAVRLAGRNDGCLVVEFKSPQIEPVN